MKINPGTHGTVFKTFDLTPGDFTANHEYTFVRVLADEIGDVTRNMLRTAEDMNKSVFLMDDQETVLVVDNSEVL